MNHRLLRQVLVAAVVAAGSCLLGCLAGVADPGRAVRDPRGGPTAV